MISPQTSEPDPFIANGPATVPPFPYAPPHPPQKSATCRSKSHRFHSKIANLPKTIRDQINEKLRDGIRYRPISKWLRELQPPLPYAISEQNISDWHRSGYQQWLLEQNWIQQTRARQEPALDLAANTDASQISHATLQLASLHAFEAMRNLGPGTLDEKLGGNSLAFSRLLNSLCRASREIIQLQQYRDACAKAHAAMQPLMDPNRELTLQERRALVREVDKILGLNSEEFRLEPGKNGLVSCKLGNLSDPAPTPAGDSPPLTFNPQPPTSPAPQEQTSKINPGALPQSAVKTPIPNLPAEATPPLAIANPNSTIENPRLENQHQRVTIEPPIPNSPREATPPTPIENQKPKLENPNSPAEATPPAAPSSPIEIQKSKIENPQRNRVRCQFCRTRAFPNQLRPWCRICGKPLPPPGQRFVTRCAACGSSVINVTNTGQRVYERCPRCDAPIPFLEPAPPPSLNPCNSS